MMTIKEFATLCGCNTQTLRYYDKIDLLKPVRVDQWTGYRYYTKSQAIDFVKIKNLQAADFTIDKIKALLTMSDQQVYEAFDRKIAEQAQKLEQIRKIQQSYQTEMNTMKNMIYSFCDQLMEQANRPEFLQEFGLDAKNAAELVGVIRGQMIRNTIESGEEARAVSVVVDDALFEGEEALDKMSFLLSEEELDNTVYLNTEHICKDTDGLTANTETIWEISGWSYTYEALTQLPVPKDRGQYLFLVRIHDKECFINLTYPLFLMGAMTLKGYDADTDLHGFVERSIDGQNHFSLLRRK